MKLIFTLLIIIFSFSAKAAPIIINFDEMMAKSKSIVTGTYLGEYVTGKIFHIEVDSVMKGAQRSGIIAVNKAKGIPRLNPGTKVMAFINQQDQWEWVGLSENFSRDVIYLKGFNDHNSYEVFPDAISMVQLGDFMKTGKYSGAIEGNLRFWSFEKMQYESSDVYFAITYTYHNSDSITTQYLAGGLKTGTFSSTPSVFFTGTNVILTYEEDPFRPLQICGMADTLKSNGRDYISVFEVSQPQNISLAQFGQYVTHPEYGPLSYNLTVAQGVTKYSFVMGEEEGEIGHLFFEKRRVDCIQSTVPTDDQKGCFKFGTWSQPEVEIVLDEISAAIDYDFIRALPGSRMLNILKFTPLTGEMFVYENGLRVSKGYCVITIEKTQFTKNYSIAD